MKIKPENIKIFCVLAPIPVLWAVLSHFGTLDKIMKNPLMDLRFKFRGEVEITANEVPALEGEGDSLRAPKVVYADFDQTALSAPEAGERPWDRKFFARVAEILLDERVGARAVGYDFIFSNKSMSKMVPEENVFDSESKIGDLVRQYPDKVVLGANYTAVSFEFQGERISSAAPLLYRDDYKPEMNRNYPEAPTYPMVFYKDGKEYGRLGLLSSEEERSKGHIVRWAPLHFPYEGDAHAKKQLVGLQFAQPIEAKKIAAAAAFEAAMDEVTTLRKENEAIENKVAELKNKITSLHKTKPATNYYEILAQIAKAQKVFEDKEASVQQLLKAIQANPAAAAALQKGVQTNVAERDAAKKSLETLKAKANAALAATLQPAIDSNKKTLEENAKALAVVNAELEHAALLASIPALEEKVAKADASLKQLEAVVKANPATATAFQKGIDTNKATKESAEKDLAESKKAIGEIELLAGFQDRLAERNKAFESDAQKWQEQLAEVQDTIDILDAQSETTKEMLLGTEKDLANAQLQRDSIQSESYDRSGVTFEKQEAKGLWLLKTKDGETLHEIPANREDEYYYHFAISMILAAYGLDGSNVKITDENLLIEDDAGKIIVDAPLVDRQLLEINWFSKWREALPFIEARESLGKHRDNKDYHEFFHAADFALEGAVRRAVPEDAGEIKDTAEGLSKLTLSEEVKAKAESILAKIKNHDGSEKLDDWYDNIQTVMGELAKQSIPPFITSRHNPRCSIIDVFNFGDFLESYRENLAMIDVRIKDLNDQVTANPELKEQAAPHLKELNTQRADFIEKHRADVENAGQFFSHFKDAIVLVGPVDPTFQDLAPTPFDSTGVPKVGVHGNLIKTLLTGEYIKRLGISWEMLGIFGLGFLMILIGFYDGPFSIVVKPVTGIVITGLFILTGLYVFKMFNLVIPMAAPACSALSTNVIGLVIMVIIEQKAKGRIKGMFGSYVSADLVEHMVESGEEPQLGGEEQEITAYFSDVQAFSAFSELLSPTGLVDLMNEYLTAMTDILQEERGTLDKYIGDAIVAMYGAPIPMTDHAYQGVKTSVLMQMRQLELRDKWKSEGDKWPDIVGKMQTRIGLNTGTATVGNMGALDRFNYTMMGDMVNLAARSESGAKAYGAYIMITEDTYRAAKEQGSGIAYRYLDKIVVKGRTQPVEMYEVTGFWDELSQDSKDCLDLFQQGIDNYLKQEWDKSEALFERAKELEPNRPGVTPGVKDNPSIILIDRVKAMRESPPGDEWDGVYIMTSK